MQRRRRHKYRDRTDVEAKRYVVLFPRFVSVFILFQSIPMIPTWTVRRERERRRAGERESKREWRANGAVESRERERERERSGEWEEERNKWSEQREEVGGSG